MAGPVGRVKRPLFKLMDRFFSDPEWVVSIHYKVFTGRVAGEPQYDIEFDAPSAVTDHVSEKSPLYEAMQQSGARHYVIRESDLPDGTTHKDLSSNDIVEVDGEECRVMQLAKAPGFVISFVATGNQ